MKTRNRNSTKKSFGARVNIALLDELDKYVEEQNKKGISTKKIEVLETALRAFLVEKGMFK